MKDKEYERQRMEGKNNAEKLYLPKGQLEILLASEMNSIHDQIKYGGEK